MRMVDLVERARQVRVQSPHPPGPRAAADVEDGLDRVMAAAARPEPIRARFEPGLPLGFQRVTDPSLVTAVRDHGDGDFILPLLQSCLGLIWFLAIGAGHGPR